MKKGILLGLALTIALVAFGAACQQIATVNTNTAMTHQRGTPQLKLQTDQHDQVTRLATTATFTTAGCGRQVWHGARHTL